MGMHTWMARVIQARGLCRSWSAGFVPYAGEGYALLLPSKWNPSREKDFPGVELRSAALRSASAEVRILPKACKCAALLVQTT